MANFIDIERNKEIDSHSSRDSQLIKYYHSFENHENGHPLSRVQGAEIQFRQELDPISLFGNHFLRSLFAYRNISE